MIRYMLPLAIGAALAVTTLPALAQTAAPPATKAPNSLREWVEANRKADDKKPAATTTTSAPTKTKVSATRQKLRANLAKAKARAAARKAAEKLSAKDRWAGD